MPSSVANGVVGDAQATQVTSLAITLPTVLTGDRLIVVVNSSNSAMAFGTLPSGTVVKDGPRALSTSQATAVLEKSLSAGDSGTSFSVPWGTAARVTLQWSIWRDAATSVVDAPTVDAAATGTFVIPTVTGVTAGSTRIGVTLRRRSGASANTTNTPAGYTAGTEARTAYAAGVNVFGQSGYVLSSAAGTVGGESFTTGGVTSIGHTYHIILPPSAPTTLADLRVGASTVGLRVGTSTPSKVYAGTTQVWP